jgi:Flp pilus assembly protein TadG
MRNSPQRNPPSCLRAARRDRRRGANAIEFALLFPVFVFLLSGLVDYGWLFMVQSVSTHAAHEGVRAGAVTMKADDPISAAKAAVQDRLDNSGVTLSPTIDAVLGGATPDQHLTVTVQVPIAAPVGLVPIPAVITTTAVMRLEDQS